MTTKIKVINTKQDYDEALKLIEALMDRDPDPNSDDGERLELLSVLVQDYESKTFPQSLPDPVDAIQFRMEQGNLKPRDLIPYIGSRSKVSEILSRKRPLTLSMIRSLDAGLGIPAKVLLKEPDESRNEDFAWNRFPIKEMERRRCFGDKTPKDVDFKTIIQNFISPLGSPASLFGMLRKSNYRALRPIDKYALVAWSAIVVRKVDEIKNPAPFRHEDIDLAFMQKVARLSVETNGPLLAVEFLRKHGILLVVEPHFAQTYLDGATIIIGNRHPIIGLTIRYDRVDHFWYTLMHELAHISLHYNQNINFFYDDLENPAPRDERENDADRLAREALIPESKWESSPARLVPSPIAAESLAKEIGIHIAIVAGIMRHEKKSYHYLNTIINQAKVRLYFPKEYWGN
jgi:HTH-type transcriptional regulator/antitoxin HigA